MKKINVICIKWGTIYSADDVNKLYAGIRRNTSRDFNFYCFTDHKAGLDANIIAKPLPKLNVPHKTNLLNYPKTAGLCDDHLGGLTGQRVFFFDIDSLIVGNLDELFAYPKEDKFYIINDWQNRTGKKANQVGQASCYSFVVGTLGYVKDYFETHMDAVIHQYGTATQQYLSAKVIEKYGALNFWPDNWFKSFRFHCMPNPLLRWFLTPKLPKFQGLKMIAFHGLPNMNEAIEGVWSKNPNHPKAPHGYKKLYKHVKPTKWILDYWRK